MLALGAASAAAEPQYGPGASDTEIKIGNTNPYSGPASAYGAIGRAIQAYFDKVNDQGGINGRRIEFISLDDGYSPPRTVEQIRKLVEQEQVLLVFQSLGTPTNTAVHQYMNAKQVPHLFVATGATKWGQPDKFPWTMGWQPNYQSEAKIYARYILDHQPEAKIGVLYQNDDYGKDYLEGFKAGLGEQAGKLIVAELSYEVTDPDGRFADHLAQEQRRRRVLQHHDAQVRGPGDPQGGRHRLAAAASAEQRLELGRLGAAAGRARQVGGPDHRALPEGPDRSAMAGQPGVPGLVGLDGPVQPRGRQDRPVQRLRLQRRDDPRCTSSSSAATTSPART